MSIIEFIQDKDVEHTKNVLSEEAIKLIEKDLQISFGNELMQYLLRYGYLAYRHIEFYGINSHQMMDSDMVKQTRYLHKYFPETEKYIALGNYGDGEYVIIASDDMVYNFDSESGRISSTGKQLFAYILDVFSEIDM